VQYDIQDFIIAEALKAPQAPAGTHSGVKAPVHAKKPAGPASMGTSQVPEEKKATTIIMRINERRPPFLWNDPHTEEQENTEHKFREHAKPQECYVDHRVERLLDKIKDLAEELRSFNPSRWELVVDMAIKPFRES
jgi:hypothetical protein